MNYIIRGGDGREYGPVSAAQLREWVRQNRADRESYVRVEGETSGRRLGEVAEFADLFPPVAARVRPVRPPTEGAGTGERLAWEVKSTGRRVRVGECFGQSWAMIQRNFLLTVGATVLMVLIHTGIAAVPVVGGLAAVLLAFVLFAGLDLLFLRLLRGEQAELTTAFAGFGAAFVALLLGSLVAHTLTALGFLLCVLPGIYLLVAWWMFAPLLMLERGLGGWEALECSRKVVTANWWACLGLAVLSGLILLGGTLFFLVGLVLAMPWVTGAIVVAYEQLFGDITLGPVTTVGSAVPPVYPMAPAPIDVTPVAEAPVGPAGAATGSEPQPTAPLAAGEQTPSASVPPPAPEDAPRQDGALDGRT